MSGRVGAAADWVVDRLARGLIGAALALPYERRLPAFGWAVAHLVAPVAGWRRRVRENLALVLPGLPPAEVRRLALRVPDNFGRALIELYSGAEFVARARTSPVRGPGLPVLEAAHAAGRPAMLVTAHLGNYDAARVALLARGIRVGALYRPMNNRFFNTHYVAALGAIGGEIFARDRRGMGEMVRFLRQGGALGILIDQHMGRGVPLRFFGRPAATALSAAELALKYDAVVIPTYAIRQPDGLSFEILLEAPVPPSTPEAMTQALNDSLEAQVRAHMDQWLWIHRRWKLPATAGGAEER